MSLKELSAKDRSVIIHNWYAQQLVIEIFKVKVGISPVEKFPTLVTTIILTYGGEPI